MRPGLPRILCVDDEPYMLSTLRRVLRSSFEVVSHPEPLAALALVQQGSSFAVVVADLNMPGMSGLELVAAIRSISPATVCILWTGDVAAARAAGRNDGVFRALGKQCQVATLRETIAEAVAQHERLNANGAGTASP
jgi:CheY-like chemotaxis protein